MKLKQTILLLACCLGASTATAQTLNSEAEELLTDGILNFDLGGKDNHLRIGGFISADGHLTEVKNDNNENGFSLQHANLSVEGSFLSGKLGFFLQTDFKLSNPLLDAYVTYQPLKDFVITAGQRGTFTNSRDMMLRDQQTAFGGRHSYMSQQFGATGRELGLYAEYRIPTQSVGLDLGVAITTGDGYNSFGSSSVDNDLGGLKYGARATVYPLGYFKRGNEVIFQDFVREEQPKLAVGVAFSYNDGASNSIGEDHGDFSLYDRDGNAAYPDYRKLVADILFKWQGFTLLADWQNTSATSLDALYTAASTTAKLKPRQIADYLVLGNGFDVQAGYLFPKLWAIDAAWSVCIPEFTETATSALKRSTSIDLGVSKYFFKNTLKVQLAGNYTKFRTTYLEPYKTRSLRLNVELMF